MVTRKTKKAAAPDPAPGLIAVDVTWRGKVRTYSVELHGERFLELAREFAAKVGGIVG